MKPSVARRLFQGLEIIHALFPMLGTFRTAFSKHWKPERLTFPMLGKSHRFTFQCLEKLALCFALATAVQARTTNSIAALTAPQPLARETVIVQGGQPKALVLHPDSAAGRAAAAVLAQAIREHTGAQLECRPGTKLDREPNQNVFMLGNVDSNPALFLLYGRFLTLADNFCPGEKGTLIHTVFDPFGKRADVIVGGASGDAELRDAADALADIIRKQPAGRDLVLRRLFLPKYGAEFLKRYPLAGRQPKASRVAEGLKEGQRALDEGKHCSIAAVLETVGQRYLLTGNSLEAKLYVALWALYARSAVADPRKYGGPWGFDSDFPSGEVVAAWDTIEHDPVLTDADRLMVTKNMARWLAEAVIPKCAGAVKSYKVPFNHQTFPALGALFAGLYYSKSCNTVEGTNWLAMADAIFKRQAGYFKPYEDCNTYQWLTHGHLMRYVVARPDFTVIENGNAKKIMDHCLGTMDNLGYEVPNGDTGSWKNSGEEVFCLATYAFLTGDPDALWAIRFKEQLRYRWSLYWLSWFHPAAAAGAAPTRFNGVCTWPLEPQYYKTFLATARPPLEKCFDKISFREALDPQAAYLLLDGLNNGGHGHRDGNSLTQLTQFDRIWLADNDYFKTAVKYHNSLLVFKDGASAPIPDYCELLGAGETPHYGFSRTRLADYAGVDWDRTVVWLKELKAFAVLDRVVPKEKGRYQFRVLWHGIGAPELAGDGMRLTQKGPSLRIQLAPGPVVSLNNDAELGKANWEGYPYADPLVRSMSATAAVELEAGEPYLFASVLHGSTNEATLPWKLRPIKNAGGVVIQTADKPDIGIVLGPVASCPADVQVIVTDASGMTVLGSTNLSRAGQRELAPSALPLAVPKPNLTAAAGAHAHRVLWQVQLASSNAAPLYITRLGAGKLTSGAAQRDILVASQEGLLTILQPDGVRRWAQNFSTQLNDVTAADLDRDGRDEIILACQDHRVRVLDAEGKPRWERKLELYRRPPYVNLVRTGDLDGDGVPEVIAGGENWRFYAFKADGTPLWNYESVHPSRSCAVADLDGGGKADVLCGTHYYAVTAVSGAGLKKWAHSHGPIAFDIATGSFDGNRTRGVVIGSGDGCVHYLDHAGKLRMSFNTGDEVKHVLAADVDGCGRDEIFAGSLNHFVLCFGADGKRRWAVDLGAGISALIAATDAAGHRVIVAGTLEGRLVTLAGDGAILANSRLSAGVVDLLANGSTLIAATAGGKVLALNATKEGR